MRILAAPNDDGFGPSALLSYVTKAILRAEPAAQITVWNDIAFDFNCSLYTDRRVTVERVWNGIQLVRRDGEVSIRTTLDRMGRYTEVSRQYGRDLAAFDLVVDFGAPAAAARARRNGIPSVTIFDHSWSKSLAMIGGKRPGRRWRQMVDAIARDERQAQRILLFPSLIAPEFFRKHWETLVGAERVSAFEGVLREPAPWSHRRAREFLGLKRPDPVILVQGGGTSVWNAPLRKLLGQLLDPAGRRRLSKAQINLVVWFPGSLLSEDEARSFDRFARVRRLRQPPGGTIQKILPAMDFLILRAGGGSVNDAVAHRKPFVCVREPAQRQIEAILEECTRRELTWPVEIGDFAADPLGAILEQHQRMHEQRTALVRRMRAIPNNAADILARQILAGA